MSEQGRGRETLGDRALRGRGLMNGAAGSAPVARSADSDDTKPGRHLVEHLADGLADPMQLAAAAGARLVPDIELHLLAGQMGRHALPVDEEPAAGRLGCCQRQGGFDPTDVGAEVLKPELELAVIEALGAPAELVALQLLDDEVKPLDLGLRFGESSALGGEGAHQPLQCLNIIWQSGEIDVHENEV
jgi:hypothetical protein